MALQRGRGDDGAEAVSWDTVALGEREEVDYVSAPGPGIGGGEKRWVGEEGVWWARSDEVAVGLVENEREAVLLGEEGERKEGRRRIYCASLF